MVNELEDVEIKDQSKFLQFVILFYAVEDVLNHLYENDGSFNVKHIALRTDVKLLYPKGSSLLHPEELHGLTSKDVLNKLNVILATESEARFFKDCTTLANNDAITCECYRMVKSKCLDGNYVVYVDQKK